MQRVYLAGGMKGDWHDAVIQAVDGAEYLDPRQHGLGDERDYTEWDLRAVRACDIVFACMTADNPSGYGMSLEIGYAAALGKTIIFVDERSPEDAMFSRYMGMARSVAFRHFSDLRHGIAALRQLIG